MSEGRRFEKRGYLKYIRRNAAGAYVYTGGYYALQGLSYNTFIRNVFLFCAPAALCVIAAGVAPNPAMTFGGPYACTFTAFYVVIPYMFTFAFTGSVVWAALRLLSNEKPLREYVYRATVPRFSPRCICSAASAGLTLAGQTVFLLLHGANGQVSAAIAAYALLSAALALPLLLRRYVKSTVWLFSGENKNVPPTPENK